MRISNIEIVFLYWTIGRPTVVSTLKTKNVSLHGHGNNATKTISNPLHFLLQLYSHHYTPEIKAQGVKKEQRLCLYFVVVLSWFPEKVHPPIGEGSAAIGMRIKHEKHRIRNLIRYRFLFPGQLVEKPATMALLTISTSSHRPSVRNCPNLFCPCSH